MKKTLQTTALPLLLVFAASALVGCAEPESTRDSHTAGGEAVPTPAFTGPWAEDFASAFQQATSDFEQEALADEKISDQEFAEMENRFSQCLTDHRLTFSGFEPGGSFEFGFAGGMKSDEANRISDDCSASSGLNTIGSVYFQIQRNPQNLDWNTIVAACLVKKKVVPEGYSASDYSRATAATSSPFPRGSASDSAHNSCSADPLGLLGGAE
jgi:hypothetical protein